MDVKTLLQSGYLILDGAMGTQLQAAGLKLGENPETLNMESPGLVEAVHRSYFAAGSQMALTNTFGANEHKLARTPYTVEQIVERAVGLAKQAAADFSGFAALDVGPIGELLEPMGALSFEEAYEIFARQIRAGARAGADAVFIETMTDLYECKAALLAAKENCGLPVFCSMSFEQDMRTFTGCSISSMALTLEGLGADAIGMNCSLGPVEMKEMARELLKWTNLPVLIKPNAGLPAVVNGQTAYSITQEQFAAAMEEIMDLGVSIVGGCCGTTPQYIAMLKKAVENRRPPARGPVCVCAVCSPSKTVEVNRVRIIGERINPTGKKAFQQALRDGNLDEIMRQAIEQVEAGADILDVNVGLPGVDEKEMMCRVVKRLQGVVDVPLQLDSSHPEVLEAALRIYNGKPIVNSVNGEPEVLARILPLVKKYGAAVVGLTLDQQGIPQKAEQRLEVARRILAAALERGVPRQDVFIDCLTLTSSAEQENAYETLRALTLVKSELGLKTVLGVSNISFGLPGRERLNQTFLAMAMDHGLDLPILNPNIGAMVDTVFCYHQLTNIDAGSGRYISRFSASVSQAPASVPKEHGMDYYVLKGLGEETRQCCAELLTRMDPLEVVSGVLIPALDTVGEKYEKNEIFLPQLIQSAEAAKGAFELVRAHLARHAKGKPAQPKRIVLATVKGDIHDIGKNIVKVVLENYGYDILDLGRDVPVEAVVEAARQTGAPLIGLSALMTTTLASMEETIKALRQAGLHCKIVVGGAVLTPGYAKEIGADYYAKDAQAAVEVAKEVFKS